MPWEDGGEGIDTRAEIQHIFSGFFPLSLSGTTMNFPFWKVDHHKNPVFSQILGLAVLNVF
jgi:hypothetical protein